MPEVLFPTIVSGTTTGADAAVMLNNVGKDDEISIRRVSAIANVGTEISFYKNGTVVYAELEKKFYKYSSVGDIWSITTDYPSPFNTGNLTAGSTKVAVSGGGGVLVNGSASVDVNESNIQHQNINGAGTNTHAQIDTHLANTSNPHATTAAQVGSPSLVTPSVSDNFVSFSNTTGGQKDSGHKAIDFLHADGSVQADFIPMKPSVATPSYAEGRIYWDSVEHTLVLMTETSSTSIQLGQENVIRGVNKTGVNIADGRVVYISGAQGNRPKISLGQANSENTSYVIGVATQTIIDNQEGYVTCLGIVRGFNTSGFTEGDRLYLSPTVAGEVTNVRPNAPNHAVFIGIALNSTVNGSIFVHPDDGSELTELHDVLITTPVNNEVLTYESTTGVWKNKDVNTINKWNFKKTPVKTTDYTVDIGDEIIRCDGTLTITLPLMSVAYDATLQKGMVFSIVNIGSGIITVQGNGSFIKGDTFLQIGLQWTSITLHADGTRWVLL